MTDRPITGADWDELAKWLVEYVSRKDNAILRQIADKYPDCSKTLAHAALGFLRGRQRARGQR
jgi:hypothetical protein